MTWLAEVGSTGQRLTDQIPWLATAKRNPTRFEIQLQERADQAVVECHLLLAADPLEDLDEVVLVGLSARIL